MIGELERSEGGVEQERFLEYLSLLSHSICAQISFARTSLQANVEAARDGSFHTAFEKLASEFDIRLSSASRLVLPSAGAGQLVHNVSGAADDGMAYMATASKRSVDSGIASTASKKVAVNPEPVVRLSHHDKPMSQSGTGSRSPKSPMVSRINSDPAFGNVYSSVGDLPVTPPSNRRKSNIDVMGDFVVNQRNQFLHSLSSRELLDVAHEGSEQTANDEFVNKHWCSYYFVVRPGTLLHLIIDLTCLLVISYDLLTLPLQAFEYDRLEWAYPMRIATSTFWVVDLVLSFFCGFYNNDGDAEIRLSEIAHVYLRTWFLPSLIIVVSDWILILLQGASHFGEAIAIARLGKVLRIARILRFVRLFRIIKVINLIEDIGDFAFSEALLATVSVMRLMFLVGVFCHFVACGWYAVGRAGDEKDSWVTHLQDIQASNIHRYAVCFHWAFAQFTPAPPPENAQPKTVLEELYVICLLFVGLVIFSSFMGSVTASLTTAKTRTAYRLGQDQKFRKYVDDNGISTELGNRILHFIKSVNKRTDSVHESDVDALAKLPKSLLSELRFEVFAPVLARHPLFKYLRKFHPGTLRDICRDALTHRSLRRGEELIHRNDEALNMFFIWDRSGAWRAPKDVLLYKPARAAVSAHAESCAKQLKEGQWMSEVTLWFKTGTCDGCSDWRHQGSVSAIQACDVVELNAHALRLVETSNAAAWAEMCRYAALYAEACSKAMESDPELLIELWGSEETVSRVASTAFKDTDGGDTDQRFHLAPSKDRLKSTVDTLLRCANTKVFSAGAQSETASNFRPSSFNHVNSEPKSHSVNVSEPKSSLLSESKTSDVTSLSVSWPSSDVLHATERARGESSVTGSQTASGASGTFSFAGEQEKLSRMENNTDHAPVPRSSTSAITL